VAAVIDVRLQTTAFNAEQALTVDTVPVNVDAIIFWRLRDAERAALVIANDHEAIDRVAQWASARPHAPIVTFQPPIARSSLKPHGRTWPRA